MRIHAREALCALFIGATTVILFSVWFAGAAFVNAQTTAASSWVGVWQAELDGQPSAILTLATDDGTLEGTLVLNGISRDGGAAHIAVRETHVLVHPRVNERTLSFEVKGVRASGKTMDFTVEQTSNGTAKMHCLNCGGNDAPTVEMTKQ
jgi:hypothetical protein